MVVDFVDVFQRLLLDFGRALLLVDCFCLASWSSSLLGHDSLALVFGCSDYLLWKRLCLIVLQLLSWIMAWTQLSSLCLFDVIFKQP